MILAVLDGSPHGIDRIARDAGTCIASDVLNVGTWRES
jgi:hypothetical protein